MLWHRRLGVIAADDNGEAGNDLANRRFEFGMGYDFFVLEDRFTLTPEFGLGRSGGYQEYTRGWRRVEGVSRGLPFELALEGTRRESLRMARV